jgi:DNA-binding transcriptional LysR family regulator
MERSRLKYFLAVVDHKGVGGAASALHLAQPTISQAVVALEAELGVALFHRFGRGMTLTAAGDALIGPARLVLRDLAFASQSVQDPDGPLTGTLDIIAVGSAAIDPLARLIAQFRGAHPDVRVRVGDLREESAVPTLLRDGHCELVLCHLPVASTSLETVVLGLHEFFMVFPPNTEVDPRDPLPLSSLPDMPWIVVPRGTSQRDEVERALHAAGTRTSVSALVQHRDAILPLVREGVGTTILERSIAEKALDWGAVIRRVEPPVYRTFGLCFDRGGLTALGSEFIRMARLEASTH